jgi:hypothetical protein
VAILTDSGEVITCSDMFTEYAAEEDGRRSSRRRQLLSAAGKESTRFENLVELIKFGEKTELAAVIDSIQQTESLDEVRGRLDQWALHNSHTPSSISPWPPSLDPVMSGEAVALVETIDSSREVEARSKHQSRHHESERRLYESGKMAPMASGKASATSPQAHRNHLCYEPRPEPGFSDHDDDWHPILVTDPRHVDAIFDPRSSHLAEPVPSDFTTAGGSTISSTFDGVVDSEQVSTQHAKPMLSNSFGNMPGSSAVRANWFPASVQQQQLLLFQKPIWALRPMAVNDGSAFCRAYMSFLEVAEATFQAGHADELMGQERLNVDLFFRPQHDRTSLNISEAVSLLLAEFPGSQVERLAWVATTVKFIKVSLETVSCRFPY